MNKMECAVKLTNVSLVYDLYYDRTTSLKEYMINCLTRRRYVDTRKEKLYALKNIDLEIRNGERLGIIGLNGAGKSTLLKVISRLLTPTTGEIEIHGSVQPLIEMGAGFNYEFSGRENIYLNGAMLGFTKKSLKEKEEEIIRFTDLDKFIDVPVKYYSSGMILRLAFTIATMVRPEILVLDEMLSAGDIEFMQKAKGRIDSLLNKAKILILVSHDLGLIHSLATRVIVLEKGEIVFEGDPNAATEFYYDRAYGRLERKEEERKQLSSTDEDVSDGLDSDIGVETVQDEPIRIIEASHCANGNNPGAIMPGDTVGYNIRFRTNTPFPRLFVNLVITDRMGVWVAHLRNDSFDIILDDFSPGGYSLELLVHNIPFRTGKYKYFFRVVGTTTTGQIVRICDSENFEFEVGGNKREHTLINCTWNLLKEDGEHTA